MNSNTLIFEEVDNFWDVLVEKIIDGDVIPVIGSDVVLEESSVYQRFVDFLAQNEGVMSNPKSFSQLLFDENYKSDRDNIYSTISRLWNLNEKLFQPSTLLQRILSIEYFPFVITTTSDTIVESTMRDVWGRRHRSVKSLIFNNNPKEINLLGDIESATDIEHPTVYYMFGKANNNRPGSFVVTDEDMLAFCKSWLTDGVRPKKISQVLGGKFLLFFGCNYPDWLIRFIWYSMRESLDKSGMLVNETIDDNIIEFTNRIHVNIERNPVLVLDEIEERIRNRKQQDQFRRFDRPMKNTDVFISYSRSDEHSARRLYEALIDKGLNVWYDRKNLAAGDDWLYEIRDAITSTKFFIPLLSNSMANDIKDSRVYRKEWNMARDHVSGMSEKRRFILPICMDNVDLYNNSLELPEHITRCHAPYTIDMQSNESYNLIAEKIAEIVYQFNER